MQNFFRRHGDFVLAGMLVVFFGICALLASGYYGGADNISHFQIARYAFRYPELFLDAWGRPLYTILAAPFAQFGLAGAKMMNVFLGVSTAYMAGRIASRTGIFQPCATMVLVCFTPLYFVMLPTALTEILFSFVLLLALYLFQRERFGWSAIVVSFLPFARTEGFVILPLFLLLLAWKRHYRPIPLLLTGIVVMSLAGAIHYQDLFWVFTRFPYPVGYTHPVYSQAGSFWHFFGRWELITGLPVIILFLAGTAGLLADSFSRNGSRRMPAHFLLAAVWIPFATYLLFHSFLYWKAMGGSMGLERVLAAVLPLTALVAAKGLADLSKLAGRVRYAGTGVVLLFAAWTVFAALKTYPLVFPLSPEEETIRRAAGWLKSSPWKGHFYLYTDNNVPYYMNSDPFRKENPECRLFGDPKYFDTLQPGTILVWDAHFGANESKIPADTLLMNSRQQVIAYFRPEKPWLTFGGGWYDCYITRTLEPGQMVDNYAIRDSVIDALDMNRTDTVLFNMDFGKGGWTSDPQLLSADTVRRGLHSMRMDSRMEFSPGMFLPAGKVPGLNRTKDLLAVAYILMPEIDTLANTLLVLSVEHRGKPYSYTATLINKAVKFPGRWMRVPVSVPVPVILSPDDILKTYIWNPGKQVLYVDKLRVTLLKTDL